MKTIKEIKKLVAKGENAAVEFKWARGGVPPDFWPSYSSFANTDGGVIILGVREKDSKREIEGLADSEKVVADLWNAANNPDKVSANVLFNESVYSVDVDGKTVVVVEVPRAERTVRPVYVGSDVFRGTYRRNGEGDCRCSREMVEGMIRDKCVETADNCILDELTIDSLNEDTIRRYRMYFSQLRPGHIWSGLADDGFLMKIGAAVRGRDGNVHPTLAGLVCFGDFNEITNVLPYFFLDYREHLSSDVRWTDRVCSGDANWKGFVRPSIVESYESDHTKVMVEFEIGASEVGEKMPEVGEKMTVVGEKATEVGEKTAQREDAEVKMGNTVSEGEKKRSENEKSDFDILMGAYRKDFRENARKVFSAIIDDQGIDTTRLSQEFGISENSVWRSIRAMKEIGLLVREGGDKGGRWIVKNGNHSNERT